MFSQPWIAAVCELMTRCCIHVHFVLICTCILLWMRICLWQYINLYILVKLYIVLCHGYRFLPFSISLTGFYKVFTLFKEYVSWSGQTSYKKSFIYTVLNHRPLSQRRLTLVDCERHVMCDSNSIGLTWLQKSAWIFLNSFFSVSFILSVDTPVNTRIYVALLINNIYNIHNTLGYGHII